MKKLMCITFLMISQDIILAQNNSNQLSFEFSYGLSSQKMGDLNEFYIDSFAARPQINLLEDKITSGEQFRLALNYKPKDMFDIGIYGEYQYGNSKSKPIYMETNDWGWPIQEHRGSYELKTEAVSIGVKTTWYISHLLKFQEKENTLNRLHLGLELSGGIGYAKATSDLRFPKAPTPTSTSNYNYFTSSQDFQGKIGLKVEYDFTKQPIITSLGLKAGYQYFKTKTVKDRLGNEWIVDEKYPINLDFSGFYFGIFLKIGK